MIPGICGEDGPAVSLYRIRAVGADLNGGRTHSRIRTGFELPAGARKFRNDRTIVHRIRSDFDPGTQRHASGELERSRIANVHVAISAEADGVAVFSGRGPRWSVHQDARIVVA